MRVKPAHRFALKLLAFGFALGAAFQLGISVTSNLSPRVTEIHHIIEAGSVPASHDTGTPVPTSELARLAH